MVFTPADIALIDGLAVGTSALSFVGSMFVVACYFYLKDARSVLFTMVMFMSASDGIGSIAQMFGNAVAINMNFCYFQAVLMSYFQLASILWCLAIAFILHMAYLRRNQAFFPNNIGKIQRRFHLIWVIALLLTIFPSFTGSYGDSGGWCWIQGRGGADTAWRIIQFYLFVWVAWIYCAFVYVSVRLRLQKDDADKKVARRTMSYPLVLFVCWTGGSVRRLVEVFGGEATVGLAAWHVATSGLFGFCNALVYGLTPAIRDRLLGKKAESIDEDTSVAKTTQATVATEASDDPEPETATPPV